MLSHVHYQKSLKPHANFTPSSGCVSSYFEMRCQCQDFGVICLYRPHAEACAAAARAGAIGDGNPMARGKYLFQYCNNGNRMTTNKWWVPTWLLEFGTGRLFIKPEKNAKVRFSAGGTHGVDFATVDSFQGRTFFEHGAGKNPVGISMSHPKSNDSM